MNTRFGRAFRYEMRNYVRAVAILWLVMALIPAAMLAITYFLAGETAMEVSFNGYSIAVGMFGLVLGMVGLRENQRVLNQNGVSRRSAFLGGRGRPGGGGGAGGSGCHGDYGRLSNSLGRPGPAADYRSVPGDL